MKHTCFFYVPSEDGKSLYITQNISDSEFFENSCFCTNELELYIMNLENFMLQLKRKDENDNIMTYSFSSHSITAYFMKVLERLKFIRIKEFKKNKRLLRMSGVSLLFLNKKDKRVPSYFISFELTDSKIDASFFMKLNRDLGIDEETFIYNENSGVFEYNKNYQQRKIFFNTFHLSEKKRGIVRNFDKNLNIWNLPLEMLKKEVYCITSYFCYVLLRNQDDEEKEDKVLEKVKAY